MSRPGASDNKNKPTKRSADEMYGDSVQQEDQDVADLTRAAENALLTDPNVEPVSPASSGEEPELPFLDLGGNNAPDEVVAPVHVAQISERSAKKSRLK